MLSVNFLLYVVLIIVFYMLVRFYLEEETSAVAVGYAPVPQIDETEIELTDIDTKSSKKGEIKRDGSFLNVNEWAGSEGTKMEVQFYRTNY